MPTVMQGVLDFRSNGNMESLLAATLGAIEPLRYNARNLWLYLTKKGKHYPTIEFRQHQGTLDPERVVKWIKTVVGIIDFAETDRDFADRNRVMELLFKVPQEKWQKDGSENDLLREERHGPIPAESSWTVIHLFRAMGLNEQADYYSTRLNQVYGTRPKTRVTVWRWEYEELKQQGKISNDDFHQQHKLHCNGSRQ